MNYWHPATELLMAQLRKELSQGILLSGPEGVGLGTLANEIARIHTREIVTVSPDEKGTISIDRIRSLYTLGRGKGGVTVFIIDGADAMGIEAQNALLKLLEEPNDRVRFILTTHAEDRLLPTIRSRVQTTAIRPISDTQSTALLDELKVTDPTRRAQLMFMAGGLPALLTRYATTNKAFMGRSQIIRDARTFLGATKEDRLILLASYTDRSDALNLIHDMANLLRRSIVSNPKPGSTDALDCVLDAEAALLENASVRLTLTSAALGL